MTTNFGRLALREAIQVVRDDHPFFITAIVLLPDHFHSVLEIPHGDSDYSKRWRLIKSKFTRIWRENGGAEGDIPKCRLRKGERGLWQRRFYEQTCRDEMDLKRCVDDCHVNPLKHGLVEKVVDWSWSSFHRYLKRGDDTENWGSCAELYGDEFQYAE